MEQALRIDRQRDRVEVAVGNDPPVFCYVSDPRFRPHVHPLCAPGTDCSMTRLRPVDHPWQFGVFVGLNDLNGYDFWCCGDAVYPEEKRGRIVNRQVAAMLVGEVAKIEAENAWLDPSGRTIALERQSITFAPPRQTESYAIDFDWELHSVEEPIELGRYDYGGLSVRLHGEMSTKRHLDSEGRADDACRDLPARWASVAQPIDGVGRYVADAEDPLAYAYAGIAIFDHPTNDDSPPRWRLDWRGLVNPNLQSNPIHIPANEHLSRRYRLWAFLGPGDGAQIDHAYQDWIAP